MPVEKTEDYYEVLQVSANADSETIDRVYRLLAQRYHPDNQKTGDEGRFRTVHQAYTVLRDPEQRARYDIAYEQHRKDRWRLVSSGAESENDFEMEQVFRLTVLEALYTQRRLEPNSPGIFWGEFEKLTGRPREHLEFTIWFLVQKKFVEKSDNSRVMLTVEGAEFLEQSYRANLQQKRLHAASQHK